MPVRTPVGSPRHGQARGQDVQGSAARSAGTDLRTALGEVAVRMDHTGSTAAPGPAAEAVIDIQVSVPALKPVSPFTAPHRTAPWDTCTARRTPSAPNAASANPPAGRAPTCTCAASAASRSSSPCSCGTSPATHTAPTKHHAQTENRSAAQHPDDGRTCTHAETDVVWRIVHLADDWAQRTG